MASAGTRAIAPPSTRSSQAAIVADDSPIRSRIVSACREPTLPANVVRATATGRCALLVGIHLGVLHRPQEVGDRLGQRAEGRDGALARLHVARVDHRRHDHGAAVPLLGHEGQRRREHHVGDRAQLVRGRLGLRDEAGDHVGRRGEDEQAADDRVDRVEPVLQARDDAEVATAAAQRPEQLRLGLRVDAAQPPVGGDDLRREQVVDRQPVLAHEEADAAGERDAADADGAGVAEARREPVLARCDGERAGGEARARPGRAPGGVQLERAQRREVDHDAAVADAVARGAVAAAADRELGPGLAGVGDEPGDVVGARDAGDESRAAVDVRGEDGPRLVVGVVLRGQDLALEVSGQLGSGEHRPRVPFLCGVQEPP